MTSILSGRKGSYYNVNSSWSGWDFLASNVQLKIVYKRNLFVSKTKLLKWEMVHKLWAFISDVIQLVNLWLHKMTNIKWCMNKNW